MYVFIFFRFPRLTGNTAFVPSMPLLSENNDRGNTLYFRSYLFKGKTIVLTVSKLTLIHVFIYSILIELFSFFFSVKVSCTAQRYEN